MKSFSSYTTCFLAALATFLWWSAGAEATPPGAPAKTLDLATVSPSTVPMSRVFGAGGEGRDGRDGVPVAGGIDMSGDGIPDVAIAHMTSAAPGFPFAGEVSVILGSGGFGESLDLAHPPADRVVRFFGTGPFEVTGDELWVEDVTGDGLGDLIICRQNFDPGNRLGAGAVTVVVGGPVLESLAAVGAVIDLNDPPADLALFTFVGSQPLGRLGIWARAGDVDGDGVADLALGADQVSDRGDAHHGSVWVVRGGPHLAHTDTVDLADFGSTSLEGLLARIVPATGFADHHLGGTCQVADLDDDGKAEVIAAAAVSRSGASIGPNGTRSHSFHGFPGGRIYVLWGDTLPAGAWSPGFTVDLGVQEDVTVISGFPLLNRSFGEEILGGFDVDGDGRSELFVADLVAHTFQPLPRSDTEFRSVSGEGWIFYRAEELRGLRFGMLDLKSLIGTDIPPQIRTTHILGSEFFALGGDTAAVGDFDGDGVDDLVFGSPAASPQGRFRAGLLHAIFGRPGGWPETIDTAPGELPAPELVRITEVHGAHGGGSEELGDILGYSAAPGDLDGNGTDDLLVNEMAGNGTAPGALDVGNLLLLSGELLTAPHPSDARQDSP